MLLLLVPPGKSPMQLAEEDAANDKGVPPGEEEPIVAIKKSACACSGRSVLRRGRRGSVTRSGTR